MFFDENGHPFIVVREQGTKERIRGVEAQKVCFSFGLVDYSTFNSFSGQHSRSSSCC
jgi:hypothetical protein